MGGLNRNMEENEKSFIRRFLWLGIVIIFISITALSFAFFKFHEERSFASILEDPNFLFNISFVLLPMGITLLITSWSNEWYVKFKHFNKWGIVEVFEDRKGNDPDKTGDRLNFIRGAKNELTIIGISNGGWFQDHCSDEQGDFFDVLNRLNNYDKPVKIFFLAPKSDAFHLRALDEKTSWEQSGNDRSKNLPPNLYQRIENSFKRLKNYFREKNPKNISVYVYDATPVGIIKADSKICLTHYLPYLMDKECPEFFLDARKDYYENSIKKTYDLIMDQRSEVDSFDEYITACNIEANKFQGLNYDKNKYS
jgi:hypothetical protein